MKLVVLLVHCPASDSSQLQREVQETPYEGDVGIKSVLMKASSKSLIVRDWFKAWNKFQMAIALFQEAEKMTILLWFSSENITFFQIILNTDLSILKMGVH